MNRKNVTEAHIICKELDSLDEAIDSLIYAKKIKINVRINDLEQETNNEFGSFEYHEATRQIEEELRPVILKALKSRRSKLNKRLKELQ